MDIYIILKYRRNNPMWLCLDCESENPLESDSCCICGKARAPFSPVLTELAEESIPTSPQNHDAVTDDNNDVPIMPFSDTAIFRDTELLIPEDPKKKHTGLKIFIVLVIVAIIAVIGVFSWFAYNESKLDDKYSKAMRLYNKDDYEGAIAAFEDLPSDYKDTAEMINSSKYQYASQLLDNGDYEAAIQKFKELPSDFEDVADMINYSEYQYAYSLLESDNINDAREIFSTLADRGYDNSKKMVNECDYQIATDLLYDDNYSEAKNIFNDLGSYRDSENMVKECDYQIADEYLNNGDYVDAMKAFYNLGSYNDSQDRFYDAESSIIYENKNNGYFEDSYSITGEWSGGGCYIKFTTTSDGGVEYTTDLEIDAPVFSIRNGVLYNEENSWSSEQLIFQYVNSSTIKVYNYNDHTKYTFTKS